MATVPSASDNIVHDVIDNGEVSGQQLLIIGMCMFFNMLDGFDITAMAVVASAVSNELQLTADKLGWIFSFALAGMMCGAMFLAPVSDIIGRRKLIILAMAIIGVSILFTATASTLLEFVVLRFISGLGAGAMLASQAALSAEYSPEKYRAFAVAAVTSGYPLGAMMTSVVAGIIVPEYGWRGMFWFGGVLTLGMIVVAWAFIPESLKYLFDRRPAHVLDRVNAILKKLKKDTLTAMPEVITRKHEQEAGIIGNVRQLLSTKQRKTTLILWTAFFLCFSTLYFLMSWIPKLVEDAGFDVSVGRDAFFLFNLGGFIGIFLMGWASTKFMLTNLIACMLLAASILMVILATVPDQLNHLLLLTLLIGILQQGGFVGLYSAAAKAYPTSIRSTGIGWSIGLGRSGAVAGPAVAGYLIAAGFGMSANYYIFAMPIAVGSFIAYRLRIK